MTHEGTRILVLGYGNPGRRDDGLGPALAEEIARANLPGVRVEINYQLAIEDAADAAEHDLVLFLDAAEEGDRAFDLCPVTCAEEIPFTSHLVSPGVVLAICKRLYHCEPAAYLMVIRGYDFSIGEGLTARARRNLENAREYLIARSFQYLQAGTKFRE